MTQGAARNDAMGGGVEGTAVSGIMKVHGCGWNKGVCAMRRECNCSTLLKALIPTALCALTTPAAQAEVVDFPDKNLETAIRNA